MKYINPIIGNPYILILPAFILCVIFSIIPVLTIITGGFFYLDIVTNTHKFVGFNNYITIFQDEGFLLTLKNTLIFTFSTAFIGIILALFIAAFLNKNNFIYNAVQSLVFTPHIISFVSIAVLWMFLMDPKSGLLNYILSWFGVEPLLWTKSAETSLLSIGIVYVWKGLGYNVMIILAGMQSVPREVYEAAKLDKSNYMRTFFQITIPMISPTLVFLTTYSLIGSFSAFDIVNLMTKGGPKNSSNLLVHWVYENGFLYYRLGNALAGSVILLLVIGTISILNYTLLNKRAHY
ncbi:ABC transporter, permease protein [Peptoniphilus sp. ING2-D1G]|nr:ABC transporter, permease protein [Peptoniphilus sp. ING2-D1G]